MKSSSPRRIFVFLLIVVLFNTLACQAVFRSVGYLPEATREVFRPFLPIPASSTPTLEPAPPSTTPSPEPSPTLPQPTETLEPTATATLVPTATPTIPATPSALQLRVFDQLWQTVHDNYLYADFNGLDWEATRDQYRPFVEAGLSQDDFYALMTEIIYNLGDDHSTFLSPQEVADEKVDFAGQDEYIGIGVLTTPVEGLNSVTVILVFPGSPAEAAGIKPHDNLLEIDGQPVIEGDVDRRTFLKGHEAPQ